MPPRRDREARPALLEPHLPMTAQHDEQEWPPLSALLTSFAGFIAVPQHVPGSGDVAPHGSQTYAAAASLLDAFCIVSHLPSVDGFVDCACVFS